MPKGLRKIVCALLVAGVAGGVILAGNRPLAVPVAGVHTPSAPGAPAQDPESNKVVDFVADRGYPIPYGDTTATVLVGHFAAQHNGAVITCDSAIRYNDKRIECFGNVLINKKETYIYGDRADYNGEINEARVYAPLVKVVDGDATLYTYDFRFNTLDNIGTFSGGGMLTNRENHLESDRGYYYADTHQIICVDRVEMRNDKYELKGDSVVYDTDTDQAHFFERTNIWNEGGDYIYADRGRYEKPRELYVLTRNGYVMTEKQELWSDSLDYYRESGHALLFRNIQIDDAEHKVLAFGDYGEYWKEPGNALLTQRPSVVSYDTSQSDSLYMCADSMFLYTISKSEQARADSLAKVKAKAAALAADSLAGSKGGSVCGFTGCLKPSAAGPKASQDGSQADAAAPQAAAGAVETSSETADAGSGSAAEPIAAVPAEKGGTGGDSLDAAPAIDTLLSDSLDRVGGGMTPADSVAAVSAVDTLFSDSLAQAGPKSLPADSSVHILSKRERKAQADSLKAQLRAQADSIASVKKAQAAAAPQGEAGADRQSTSGSGYCQARRCETEGGGIAQKEPGAPRRTYGENLGQAACQNREGDPERQASGVGSRFAGRRLPAGGQGFCRVGFFVPGLSCCGFAGTRFHAARFAQGRGCGSGLFAGGFDRCTCWRFPLPVGQGVSPGKDLPQRLPGGLRFPGGRFHGLDDPALYRSRALESGQPDHFGRDEDLYRKLQTPESGIRRPSGYVERDRHR